MDIEELRRQIDSGELDLIISDSCCIGSGSLSDSGGTNIDYTINHGWNVISASLCDKHWSSYQIELMQFIEDQAYDEDKLNSVLSSIQIEDLHWDWFKKSIYYRSDEYEWFYMFANNKPQGACLIYHPKPSAIDGENIFYVEYLATAPWNRNNPMAVREFKGVGSIILKCVLDFAVNTLHLKPGFSLHSLPQAVGYYEKLGMMKFQDRDKEKLAYFEMPRNSASKMLGVA